MIDFHLLYEKKLTSYYYSVVVVVVVVVNDDDDDDDDDDNDDDDDDDDDEDKVRFILDKGTAFPTGIAGDKPLSSQQLFSAVRDHNLSATRKPSSWISIQHYSEHLR